MNSAQTVIEKLTFQDFPQINAIGIKFELAIKLVKVNLDSSFVQSPMLHTKSQSQWPFGSREEDI